MSTVIFIGYAICRKNQPHINAGIFLPSFAGGVLWAAGMIFWFLSAAKLSQSIAGPIIAMIVGVTAAFWSVFYFKEIKSGKSMYMLGLSLVFATVGSLSMALSKYGF
uniref:Uncharacterized protein n=1 Tax=Ditylenchus dipsaci TaxID=166011 RepID=A0A915CZD2_9BILA